MNKKRNKLNEKIFDLDKFLFLKKIIKLISEVD